MTRSRSLVPVASTYPSDLLTCEDLWAIPDDGRRREIIDGALVVNPSPLVRHQRVSARLHVLLASACPPDAYVLAAPLDYRIGDHTLVIPDLIVARTSAFSEERLERTPMLIVEIRSPSTARYDAGTKRLVYEAAGVPWYWMGDPDEPSLTVLELVDGSYVERAHVAGADAYDAREPIAVRVVPAALIS